MSWRDPNIDSSIEHMYTEVEYPNTDYINPHISDWELIKILTSNHISSMVYSLDENGEKIYQMDTVVDGRLYNVTFVGLNEYLDEVTWMINKTCFVPEHIYQRDSMLFYDMENLGIIADRHRVYYSDLFDDLWQIEGIFEWVVGFENGAYN